MDKIFLNGIISKDIPETAPAWILGKFSMNVPELKKWLDDNSQRLMDNGWINFVIKKSEKTGKRYIEVDTYKPVKPIETLPEVKVDTGEVPTKDVPF